MNQHIKRVRVEDFQSLQEVDLELGPLTVIVGHSSSGKSAIVRALQAALFNRQGGAFVREGAERTRVEIEFAEAGPMGNVLWWEKPRKGGSQYRVLDNNGIANVISRVNKEMPPQIAELTGIREIEFENVRAVLNLSSQFDPPFLLSGTGGQAARLLSRVARTDVIVLAQVKARRDLQATKAAADKASEAVTSVLGQLTAMPDYEAKLEAFEALGERLEKVVDEEERLGRARQQIVHLEQARAKRNALPPALSERVRATCAAATALTTKARLVQTATEARFSLESARRNKKNANFTLAQRNKAVQDAMNELDVCLLCGKPMKGD